MHRSEVVANLTEPLKLLLREVAWPKMAELLTLEPRPARAVPGISRRLTSDEIDQLVARYKQTKNMRQVAREFRISRTTVREHLWRYGITVRSSKPMSELQKTKARELWVAGMPGTMIGKKLGFSHHTILRAVRKPS